MSEPTNPGRGAEIAQRILGELMEIREQTGILREFAEILAGPQKEGETFLQTVLDTQSRLIDAQAVTLEAVQNLHRVVQEPMFLAGLRRVVSEAL